MSTLLNLVPFRPGSYALSFPISIVPEAGRAEAGFDIVLIGFPLSGVDAPGFRTKIMSRAVSILKRAAVRPDLTSFRSCQLE